MTRSRLSTPGRCTNDDAWAAADGAALSARLGHRPGWAAYGVLGQRGDRLTARMSVRRSFLLRMDPETLDAVQRWANDDFRSLNGHIEFLLRRALRDAGRLSSPNATTEQPPPDARDDTP